MTLVEIRDLTEAQAQAWVAGPLTEDVGRECKLEVWAKRDCIMAAVFIGRDHFTSDSGPTGDFSQSARDAAAMGAVKSAVWARHMLRDAILVPGEESEPEFKRGACACGYVRFLEIDESGPEWYFGGDRFPWPTPVGRCWYCPSCGSLLGPNGWAMLVGRDPKAVQWPEDGPTSPDTPANREEDSNG